MSNVARYAWLSARARNALRHWAMISITAGTTFIAVLIGLVLIPRQVSRATHVVARTIQPRPESTAVLAIREQASTQLMRADSALIIARRASVGALAPVPVDTLSPELRAERDSLNTLLVSLNSAMVHAAETPLPPSFRALGETPALRNNPQVRVWLDSLDQVDKLRAPFGALGAGDPTYVTLTARVNEIGRSIRDAATDRRSELRARVAPLLTAATLIPHPQTAEQWRVDTISLVAMRTSAARAYTAAIRTLDSMHAINAHIDAASTAARDLANIGAPPAAMLAAAFVIALAVGFTIVFLVEVRTPTIANPREAESVSATRVLAVIRPTEVVERGRRHVDIDTPPLIDLISESYRTLYLHLAATDASVPIITVTGDTAAIVATVAANLAAVAAYEARSTLLVDADVAANVVASILRLNSEPGLSGILNGTAGLSDAIVSTTIGRDRPLDVLPSGTGRGGTARHEQIVWLYHEFSRMGQRYDLIVIAAPTSYAQLTTHSIIPATDVVLCARIGDTALTNLRTAVKSLRSAGRYVHGLVLWDDETPRTSTTR